MTTEANNEERMSDNVGSIQCTANRYRKEIMAQKKQQCNPFHSRLPPGLLCDMPVIQFVESLQHKDTKITSVLSSPAQDASETCRPLTALDIFPLCNLTTSTNSFKQENRSNTLSASNEILYVTGICDVPSLSSVASEQCDHPNVKKTVDLISLTDSTTNQPGVEDISELKQPSGTDSKLNRYSLSDSVSASELSLLSVKSRSRPSTSLSPELMPAPRLPLPSRPIRTLSLYPPTKRCLPRRLVATHPAPGASPVPGMIRSRRSSLTFRTDEMKTGSEKTVKATVDKSEYQEDVVIEPDILFNVHTQISEFQQIFESERKEHCPATRHGPPLSCNFCWNTVDADGRTLRRKTKYHCPECNTNLCIVPCFHQFHDLNAQR